jgi:hypothetical protein
MPAPSIASLVKGLSRDVARKTTPFSTDLAEANDRLFSTRSDHDATEILRAWLHHYQPCLFGRMAAGKPDLISFCVLTERDLAQSDSAIRQKIQQSRLSWKRKAFLGEKSAFLVVALSRTVCEAAPDHSLQALAVRLGELYLLEAVLPDTIYHDRLSLEVSADHYREWVVGVNLFAAQGDGRWWQDHRLPGGIGFSTNSVGHMIRSGSEHNERSDQLEAIAGLPHRKRKPLDSLDIALKYAMLSINRASEAVSGKATCLRDQILPMTEAECPLSFVPPELKGKDWTKYAAWYDTDITIPSSYFRPDVRRPADIRQLEMDFTYLFDDANIDYHRTGPGVQTR